MAFEKKVSIAIIGKTDKFVKELNKGQKALKSFGTVAGGIGKVAAGGLAVLGVGAATVGKEMVQLASDATEAASAFDVVFKDSGPGLNQFVDEFANKAGLASFELQDLLKSTGALLQGIDMGVDVSADFSKSLATMAGDVAAFQNVQGGAKPVMEAFTKALLGERESLKTYDIAISEAEVQTQAFAMTGKTVAAELTRQEKALATYELLLKKTTPAVGYLNKEQDSFASRSNQASAQIKELKVQMGEKFLPVVTEMIPKIMDLVEQIGPQLIAAADAAEPFIRAIADALSVTIPIIAAVASLFLKLLAPAFKKFSEIVNDYMKPFLENLPKNFENMINRIVRALNKFIDKINGFASKVKGILSKIGIDLGFGEIGRLAEVNFTKSAEVKSVVGTSAISPDKTIEDLSKSALASAAQVSGQVNNVTVNNYAPITNPQEMKNAVVTGLKEINRTDGPLNRIITIQ